MTQWRYPFALLGIAFLLVGYALWPRNISIPVLIYHDIASSTQPADSYTVEGSLLSRELDYLHDHGYTPLTFSAAAALRTGGKLPAQPVILTFDDALPGQRTVALPLLQSRRVAATFFITSALVGDGKHMTWADVLAISAAGMEIGGHSKTHAHLNVLTQAALIDEVAGDKVAIENEIGKPLTVFAYPFGERDLRTDDVLRTAHYSMVRLSAPARIDTIDGLTIFGAAVQTNSFDSFLKALE